MKKSAYSFLVKYKDYYDVLDCINKLLINNQKISIDYVAKTCYMSKATVTRFFQANGFNGFKEFIYLLLNEYNEKVINYDQVTFDEFENEFIFEAIIKTKSLNKLDLFAKAYQLMIKAKTIYIVGVGGNNSICYETKTRFERFGFNARQNFDVHGMYISITNATKNDIAFIFSYTGETTEVIKIANLCKEKKIKIIAITRNGKNTLSSLADIVFKLDNSEPLIRIFAWKSRIAMFYLVYKLCVYIYKQDHEKYENLLKGNVY